MEVKFAKLKFGTNIDITSPIPKKCVFKVVLLYKVVKSENR